MVRTTANATKKQRDYIPKEPSKKELRVYDNILKELERSGTWFTRPASYWQEIAMKHLGRKHKLPKEMWTYYKLNYNKANKNGRAVKAAKRKKDSRLEIAKV